MYLMWLWGVVCRPPALAWGASDSNMLFLVLLIITLAASSFPAGVFMQRTMECNAHGVGAYASKAE